MGIFSRDIAIKSGILFVLFADGWFRTGTRPNTRCPTAEIYALTQKDDPLALWSSDGADGLR